MSKANEGKLRMRDIATIGIFGALLFVVTMLAGALMGISMTLNMYSVAIVALLSAPLFMLIMAKVHKKGAVILTCAIVGLLWALFGGIFILIWMLVLGVVGEVIASKSNYQNYKVLTVSFALYSVAYYLGAIAPLYYYPEYVYGFGYPEETADALIQIAYTPAGYIAIPVTLVAILAGALIAKKLLKKHFEKAGVI
jgi:energy-coupling factor transport system substrate-specific component